MKPTQHRKFVSFKYAKHGIEVTGAIANHERRYIGNKKAALFGERERRLSGALVVY
jgi:hypothetical protein